MARRGILAAVLAMVLGVAVPAYAAECSDLFGIARLQASGAGTAVGTAIVFLDGAPQLVSFTSEVNSDGTVSQSWDFDEGPVAVTEQPNPVFLPGPWQTIDSSVSVDAPDSGEWEYDGAFNEKTLVATFVVTGSLCFGA